jgi:hypothetical protein
VTIRVLLLSVIAFAVIASAAQARSDIRPDFEIATCDVAEFPIDALTGPTGAQRRDTGSARALRRIIRDPRSEPLIEGRVPKHRWRLLSMDRSHAVYGAGGPRRIAPIVLRRSHHGTWKYSGFDPGCDPRVVRHRLSAEFWALDPDATPSPTSQTLSVLVGESNCNSGDPPDLERIREPVIAYGAKEVTITYFVDPPNGDQTCPGAPARRVSLDLAEPLGDRELLDGGTVVPHKPQLDGATSYPRPQADETDLATHPRAGQICGTKELYGHELTIKVRGDLHSCSKVRRIVRGKCDLDSKPWACFSFQTPGPILAWFLAKEMFKPELSSVITASRYPCSEVGSIAEEWVGPSLDFPTRKQVVADDLIRCNLLDGRDKRAVKELLGGSGIVSTSHGRTYFDYTLGPERDSFFQIDSELLSVVFNSRGIFREATIYQG